MRLRSVSLAGMLALASCNASSQQVTQTVSDGLALAGCVLSQILVGITDPAQLLTCAGATEALIVDVIDDFTAQHATDAGLAAMPTLSPQQVAWLAEARLKAVTALAAKHPGGK